MEIQEPPRKLGCFCAGKRDIIQDLLDGNQMRKDENFNPPQAMGGFRKEIIIAAVGNSNGISDRRNSAIEDGAKNQLARSQLGLYGCPTQEFTCAERSWQYENESLRTETSGSE